LKLLRDNVDNAIPFDQRTLPALLARQARLGNRPFIRSSDASMTYGAAEEVAARCAGKLRQAGVNPGDRVLSLWSNRLELLQLWLGTAWCGAILVPINTAYRGQQLRNLMRIADPSVVVAEADLLPHLASVSDALVDVRQIWITGVADHPYGPTVGNTPVTEWVDDGEPVDSHPVQPGDPAAILYTSGTSGPSKGVICPHGQFYWWAILTGNALGVGADDVLHTTLPFFHTNALNSLWQALVNGATYSFAPKFSATRFWEQIRDADATVTYLLGVMIQILLKAPPAEHDRDHRLRIALSPGTPAQLVDDCFQRFGVKLLDGYGSTETNLILCNTIGQFEPGTMGRADPHFELRVVDENDCPLPAGTAGELIVRHKEPFSMASGYFSDPEATVAAWRNLWFHTGDLVVRDDHDVYRFVDRVKDSIRRRGENISSWEVEQALQAHPDVESAAVVGVPAELGEDEVMAFIVLQSSAQFDPLNITRFLETQIAYFAIPRYLDVVNEMPKTENGKVKKFLLRARGVEPETWDRDAAGVKLRR
jgi:crotonobetaine/carnitine-CoA ligase